MVSLSNHRFPDYRFKLLSVYIDIETYYEIDNKWLPTLDPFIGEIRVIALYNPINQAKVLCLQSKNISETDLLEGYFDLLHIASFTIANAKYEWKWFHYKTKLLLNKELNIKIEDDTLIFGKMLDNRKPAGLKPRCCIELDELSWGIDLKDCSESELIRYALFDVPQLYKLREKLYEVFYSDDFIQHPKIDLKNELLMDDIREKLLQLYRLELECVPIYAQMELYSGLHIDVSYAKRTYCKASAHIDKLNRLLNLMLPGCFYPVNVSSAPKMKLLLYHPDYLDISIKLEYCERSKKYMNHENWLLEKLQKAFSEKKDLNIHFVKVLTGYDTLNQMIKDTEKLTFENIPSVDSENISRDKNKTMDRSEVLKILSLVKECKKLKSTLSSISNIRLSEDNLLHFNVFPKQVSGRLSISGSKPSLNLSHNPNIDKGENYPFARSLVIPAPGCKIISADFKNEEVRILLMELKNYLFANVSKSSGDEKVKYENYYDRLTIVMNDISNGLDPVCSIISEYYKLGVTKAELGLKSNKIKQEYPDLRTLWKGGIVFGLFYGQSRRRTKEKILDCKKFVLENDLNKNGFIIPSDKDSYKRYRTILEKLFPCLFDYLGTQSKFASRYYFIASSCGRIRKFEYPLLVNYKNFAESMDYHEDISKISREAKNFPVQSFASFVLRKLLIRFCAEYPISDFKKTGVRLLLPRHDEILFECRKDLVKPVKESLVKIVENLNIIDLKNYGYDKNFQLAMDIEVMDRWSDK